MNKKIYILLGHSAKKSLNLALANAYEESAKLAGFEIRRQNIGEMSFNPILREGYSEIQTLEPDLILFQENIKWCDHFVIIYPTWWYAMPAILKGLFDRAWLPGFAYKFRKNGLGWEKFLKGKTARIIITSGSRPILHRIFGVNAVSVLKKGILEFAGIKTKVMRIAPVQNASEGRINKYIKKVKKIGYKGK